MTQEAGAGRTLFGPNAPVTQGMVITALYRLDGSPDITYSDNPVDDADAGNHYADAAKWAAARGIIPDGDDFMPGENISREDSADMFYRFQQSNGKIPRDIAADKAYADRDDISDHAQNTVNALTKQGIFNGRRGGKFDPHGELTRAELAAVLGRFRENAGKDALERERRRAGLVPYLRFILYQFLKENAYKFPFGYGYSRYNNGREPLGIAFPGRYKLQKR